MGKRPSAPARVRRPRLKAPTLLEVTQVAFALAKELSLELREEEMVGTFAAALRRLLPGRLLCLRVIDPRSFKLSSMVADGALLHGLERAPLEVKRTALRPTRLTEGIGDTGRIRVADGYAPVFAGAASGFSVPLVASGEMFGLLNVEYPPGADVAAADEAVVIPLANQLSVALRNLHLLGETRYYRDYLRKMIDAANALIIVIDREQRIAVMNKALQRYCGFGADVIGRPISEIRMRSAEPEPRLSTLLTEGLNGREYEDVEVSVARHNGTVGRALVNTSVLRAADGSIDGVIAIGQDRDRIRSLERQVIQAEKLATLGQLAAGVVHELNNPLTSISVYGDYLVRLLEKRGDPIDLDKARKIVDGAGRIQKLTRDLMTYARPAGEVETVAINEVVRQALVFCEHVLKRADAIVELRLAEDLPPVRAIRTQLHQVLINLLTNACHALPAPDQALRLATSLTLDGAHVLVEVADSGVGIDAADGEHIFEPFFTTKKEGKGTGLGLSIVKNIVEGHGGTIAFQSRVGQGTTFFITLPIEKESP
ncbi:MAG TPA: ATP-binding protein [Polyangia bacterium]|nr:ATP-binding protein [Polyangia bacterium]